ncbi:PP2C family protein-serine/threonine phosphatase [Nocardia sp. XZ_19_385]|uniref:PP2C family protein-serine/threonine phosphatase n=1 Tax=Nocardia sp. XZ_19_385 TaxID=2769488 RepID=UPI001E5344C2|nr:fused response regulator/phosphatase [Nocardia sp. XZ_19_385]
MGADTLPLARLGGNPHLLTTVVSQPARIILRDAMKQPPASQEQLPTTGSAGVLPPEAGLGAVTQPHPGKAATPIARSVRSRAVSSVLLVEGDPGAALLVAELVADGSAELQVEWVRSLAEAGARLATGLPDCVLLDLHLPDAQGLDALARLQGFTDEVAVVVMTGRDEEQTGLAAVAAGAQDYLVKGRVEAELFGRAVRYAIQRKQAERMSAALRVSNLRAEANLRLERGLLPKPLLRGEPVVDVAARYRPGRDNTLLSGDFYDVVQEADGTVHALIGDVSGHGPDEAAIGVGLRLAWRTLVFSGVTGVRQMRLLEEILVAERTGHHTFATVTTVYAPPGAESLQVVRAGHPGMLVRSPTKTEWVEVPGGPALGFRPGRAEWPVAELTLAAGCGLMLVTDGLFEVRVDDRGTRLGEAGLLAMANTVTADQAADYLDELIGGVESAAASTGGLEDDVAVVYLQWRHPQDLLPPPGGPWLVPT